MVFVLGIVWSYHIRSSQRNLQGQKTIISCWSQLRCNLPITYIVRNLQVCGKQASKCDHNTEMQRQASIYN